MAEKDEDNALERFGWTYGGAIEYLDDDGNWVRGGPVPPEVQELVDQHEKVKAKDARMKRQRPTVKVHIHRK